MLPILDLGPHVLITDLQARDMLDDVSIVAWGEIGRTPKINGKVGRDDWPHVEMGMLAGGGIRSGQVIGATAGTAVVCPVHYKDVFATLYHNLASIPTAPRLSIRRGVRSTCSTKGNRSSN